MNKPITFFLSNLTFVLSCFLSANLQAQCNNFCNQDVLLTSQAEVDAFCGCSIINGSLRIGINEGNDIQNVLALDGLKEVKGNVDIVNTQLNNLDGLGQLQQIGHSLLIHNNDQLKQVDALNLITNIQDAVSIFENSALENVYGLGNLKSIQNSLIIDRNPKLDNLHPFANIQSLNYVLRIRLNDALRNLEGLMNLKSVGEEVSIISNNSLTTLKGLDSLRIAGGLIIGGNPVLEDCCRITHLVDRDPNNGNVRGNININLNPSLCSSIEEIVDRCQPRFSSCNDIQRITFANGFTIANLNAPNVQIDVRGRDSGAFIVSEDCTNNNCTYIVSQPGYYNAYIDLLDENNESFCYTQLSFFVPSCENRNFCQVNCDDAYTQVGVTNDDGQVFIQGLSAPQEIVEVFNENDELIFSCSGTDCGRTQILEDLPYGFYYINVQFFDEAGNQICSRNDIPFSIPADSILDCGQVRIGSIPGQINISGIVAANKEVFVFDQNQQLLTSCQNNNCPAEIIFDNLAAGNYFVTVLQKDNSGRVICEENKIPVSVLPSTFNCTHPDYNALVALYNSTNGRQWRFAQWNLDDCDVCNWPQVNCDANGRVIELLLATAGLQGPLPPEIGELTFLQLLAFSSNQITGIPEEIAQLKRLTTIFLGGSNLTSFPIQLTNVENLEILELDYNDINNLPPEIGRLRNLKVLDLANNQLTGSIPIEIAQLPKLENFKANNNQLNGTIPDGTGLWPSINSLNLIYNQLTGTIPNSLITSNTIRNLELRYNQLSGQIPAGFFSGNIDYRKSLIIGDNNLSGCIPDDFRYACDNNRLFFFAGGNPQLAFSGDGSTFCGTVAVDSNNPGICPPEVTGDCAGIGVEAGDNQISITGLTAPIKIVQVFDLNYNQVFRCQGTDCGNEQIINNLTTGTYIVGVQFYTANWESICSRENINITVTDNGDDLTDDSDNSDNDNTSESADCNSLIFTPAVNQIRVDGLNTAYSQVQIIGQNTNWQVLTICQGDCAETQIIPNLSAGEYTVKVQLNGNDGTDCYREEKVTTESTPPPTNGDCEDLNITISNNELLIRGLTAPIEIVQVFDQNYNVVFRCQGNDCGNEQIIGGLAQGIYFVGVQFYTADWGFICSVENITVTIGDSEETDTPCEETPKEGFTKIGNTGYKVLYVSDYVLSTTDAKQACINTNSQLATSLAPEVINFIKEKISNEVFIDLSDTNQEGVFQWANGSRYDGTVHGNSETNDIVFIANWSNDLIATNEGVWKHFVCEVPCVNSSENRTSNRSTLEQDIRLFPNPAQSSINLQIVPLIGKKGNIQIYNVYGQLIQQFDKLDFNQAHLTLDVQNFENGIYLLTIQADKTPLISKRFVVEHWK